MFATCAKFFFQLPYIFQYPLRIPSKIRHQIIQIIRYITAMVLNRGTNETTQLYYTHKKKCKQRIPHQFLKREALRQQISVSIHPLLRSSQLSCIHPHDIQHKYSSARTTTTAASASGSAGAELSRPHKHTTTALAPRILPSINSSMAVAARVYIYTLSYNASLERKLVFLFL